MSKNRIRDGQTRDGFVAKVDRLHDGISFKYRPMLARQVEQLSERINTSTGEAGADLISGSIVRQLESWSEVDDDEKPLPINFENVSTTHYPVWIGIHRIIMGHRASDPPPNPTGPSTSENSTYITEIQSIVKGEKTGPEADRKN